MRQMPNLQRIAEQMIAFDRRCSIVALLVVHVMLMPALSAPVNALRMTDQAICKDIDWNTLTCKDKSSEFISTDKWAYFWLMGSFDISDSRAKLEFRFYDPDGQVFATSGSAWFQEGSMVMWMGVGLAEAVAEGGYVSSGVGLVNVQDSVEKLRADMKPLWPKATFVASAAGGIVYAVWIDRPLNPYEIPVTQTTPKQPASEKPGGWRAEFTRNEKVVAGESFTILGKTTTTGTSTMMPTTSTTATSEIAIGIATQPTNPESPSALPIIVQVAAIIVIVALAAGYIFVRAKPRAGAR
jgi:hypothetical protein